MSRFLIVSLILLVNQHPAIADGADWISDQHKIEESKKQKMEAPPASSVVGGAQSGAVELEKKRDRKFQETIRRQKSLYESDNHYRYGL